MVEDRVVLTDPEVRRPILVSLVSAGVALAVILTFFRPDSVRQWASALALTVGVVFTTAIVAIRSNGK